MPNAAAAPPERQGRLGPALVLVGAVTALRVALLAFSQTDLFVDEAQYWLWGQDFAFGYYSKPPLIAWVIGATTALAGSDAPFWVRLPAPLFHAATALILAGVAARLHSDRAAVVTAAVFVTLPMVTVGSLLISTDTIMFPFLALALAGYLRLVGGAAPRPGLAALVGLCLGLAFLAKYAALFYLALGALAALVPQSRPRPRDAVLLLGAFALTALPNLLWNLRNGLSTLSHTLDNTGWREGLSTDPGAALRFLGEQFLVFGPVLTLALLIAAMGGTRVAGRGLLVVLSLPIVALVTLQALISGANANWAAPAYLAGTVLAVAWLIGRHRAWLVTSFVLNGAVALALPLAATRAETLRLGDGPLLLRRYAGLDEMSRAILAEAEARGVTAIVAAERAVLADLFYTGRDSGLQVFAWPFDGLPRNHYEQRYPFAGETPGPVLAVARGGSAPPCADTPDGTIEPGPGAYDRDRFDFWVVPATCWASP